MTDRIRRSWSAVLRWAKLRPPQGHMAMLREEVGRRDDVRLARGAQAAGKPHVSSETGIPDASE